MKYKTIGILQYWSLWPSSSVISFGEQERPNTYPIKFQLNVFRLKFYLVLGNIWLWVNKNLASLYV